MKTRNITGLAILTMSLGCLVSSSSVRAQQYLVGAYLFSADGSGATTTTNYQYDTNNSDSASTLTVGASGKNFATSLPTGSTTFSFSQTLNAAISTYGGSAGDLGLFFSSTNTPYNSATPRTPDLIVSRPTNGSTAFFTPVAGTAINSYYYTPNAASIIANGATSITLGSNIISVSAFSVTDTPGGSFTLNVSPVASTPEPGSIALLVGMGLSGAAFLTRRRKRA